MATNPDSLFADLLPGGNKAPAPIYGAPPKVDVPSGYEPDPSKPGALRPQPGGPSDPEATAESLDPETVSFYAQQVLTGAPLPPMGMGKQASKMRAEVMKEVARQAGAMGMSGNEFAAQVAHYKAGTASLTKMQTMHDQIRSAEQTALLNGKQLIELSNTLPGQGNGPIINSLTQTAQRYIPGVPGHDQIAAYDAAYTTFVNEYAKVVSGSPSGAGVLSDSARHEAMETLRKSTDPSQKRAAYAQMQKDMANRMDAINAVIKDGYKNLSGRYDQTNVAEDPAQAALPADWIKAHPDSLAALGVTGPTDGGGGGGGGDTPPGAGELTPEQQKADRAFLSSNPQATPEQYAKFLQELTGEAQDLAGTTKRLKAAQAGGAYSGAVDRTAALDARIKQEDSLGVGETPAEALAAQGRTFNLSDEASGVGNALANGIMAPFSSNVNFDPVGSYTFGRDAERLRIANARKQLGYGGSAIEFASSLASANPAGALDAIAPRAAAGIGALAGFGGGEGTGESLGGGGAGALGGYVVGRYAEPALAATGRFIGRAIPQGLKTRLLPSRGMAPEIADAATAENVPLIRPMVDAEARAKYGTLESSPAAQSTIRQGFGRVLGAIEDRVKGLGGEGTAFAEADQTGAAGQTGAKAWLAGRKTLKNRLYDKAESLAGNQRFVPQDAIAEADAVISDLSGNANANAAEINFLKGYRDDLANKGGKTVAEIRNLREGLRQSIDQNRLTMDGAGVRALRILDAAKGDIAKNVPEAAQAYARADKYFATSQAVVDDLKASILGTTAKPIEPQVAAKNLRAMVSDTSTGRRFARIMGALDSDTRQDIAATWANSLGRAAPDAPFELGKFLNQTNGLSPSALRTAFGPEAAQSVKNLRVLSRALQDSGKDVNYSRSGTNIIRYLARNFLTGVTGLGTVGAVASHSVEGAGAGAAAGLAVGAASGVRDILSARAMVNPRVSQWLAEAANVSNRTQAHAALRKLSVIINREPALAAELTPLYTRIGDALSQPMNVMPLAAEPNSEGGQQNDE